MGKVLPFGISSGSMASGSGSGPEDPMLEPRVERLERILASLEPKINEILLTGAKQADLQKLELKVAEIAATGAKQADLHKLQLDVAEMKGRITGVEGRIGGVEAKISGLDSSVAKLPNVFTMLGLIVTTWGIGSAILVFAISVLRK